jgi:hypothetical protein
MGFIATGRCQSCGAGVASRTSGVSALTCPVCSTAVRIVRVEGSLNDRQPCDSRCQYAAGPSCSCSCGGENHGAGYIEAPELFRERDTARYAKRVAAEAAEGAAKAAAIIAAIEATVEDSPLLADLTYPVLVEGNDFLSSLSGQLLAKGWLSDRQVQAAERALVRDIARANRQAAEALLPVVPVVEGRIEITGMVLSTKFVENDFGGALKMLVRDDRGFRVWSTVPSAISSVDVDHTEEDGTTWHNQRNLDRDDRVAFTATITKSDRDESFGFASRPSKARVLTAAQATFRSA